MLVKIGLNELLNDDEIDEFYENGLHKYKIKTEALKLFADTLDIDTIRLLEYEIDVNYDFDYVAIFLN
jgi:hypothetical protein